MMEPVQNTVVIKGRSGENPASLGGVIGGSRVKSDKHVVESGVNDAKRDVKGSMKEGENGVGNAGPSADASVDASVDASGNAKVSENMEQRDSLPTGSGKGNLQRRLLGALKEGAETSIQAEGESVDLSFWTERHGLRVFQEEKGGETIWTHPTAGGDHRNVARLFWKSKEATPSRKTVVELFLQMGFEAKDIYALIHPYGTKFFDVSFVRPEGLELFWSRYDLTKSTPECQGFAVQAITRQNKVKKVTVLTCNESLSSVDIATWLSHYGEVGYPAKVLDEHSI
ncbi:zinc finger CCHC domain-containing protein 3-like [Bufo bufo]|uniref:zinc finger CCHC domain-containing protein 3-like n=1 Tax=Bufo bufo TaxID=8384 RepID=UPI001ABE472D|nr:zinc finger CCHC domain-containing protein 3-like [Bufo bufo]